jgi:aspartyl-tRNA synthetase
VKITRSHHCGQLRGTDLGKEVNLVGWVATRRDHGGLVFIDLRDRYGLTQVVFDPALKGGKTAHDTAGKLRGEYVMWCKGTVRKRPEGMTNSKMVTGEIEVACTELTILSEAKTPPFAIDDEAEVSENIRF